MKWVVRALGLVVLLVALVIGGLLLLPGDRLARIAADQLSQTLGREVTILGAARPTLWPTLGVRAGPVEVAGFAPETPLLRAEAIGVAVDAAALLGREVVVRDVTLVRPVLHLERDADGRANWTFGGARPEASGAGTAERREAPAVSFDVLTITDGALTYEDGGTLIAYEGIDLEARMPEAGGALDATFGLAGGGQRLAGTLQVAPVSALLAGETVAVIVAAEGAGNGLRFEGFVAPDGRVKGDLDADLPRPSALAEFAGLAPLDLPGEVLPLSVAGALEAGPQAVALTGARIAAGANAVDGDVSVALGAVPRVTADLSAGALDLAFLSAEEGSAGDPAAGGGWSRDPIDVSALALAEADVALRAASVDLGATQMQDAALRLTLEDRRAVAAVERATAFGGALTGNLVVNGRGGLSVGGALDGRTVAVGALLTDIAGFERLRGVGEAELEFLGAGPHLEAIMRSLSGRGAIRVGDGALTGVDLARIFGGGDAMGGDAVTIFSALGMTFAIEGGVLRNDDLAMEAPLFEARGEGRVDLGGQAIDYTLTPRVFRGAGEGLAIPVRIVGPWAGPRIFPDLEAVAEQRLAVERERLEAEARARLEEERARAEARLAEERAALEARAREELGAQEGQSIEDAARETVEREVLRGLGNLLNRN